MIYNKIGKKNLDFAELQGSIVCAMLGGKYKKPKELSVNDLKAKGMITEGVVT